MIDDILSFGDRNCESLSRLAIFLLYGWSGFLILTSIIGLSVYFASSLVVIGMSFVTFLALLLFFLAHPSYERRMKVKPIYLFSWLAGQVVSLASFFYVASLS